MEAAVSGRSVTHALSGARCFLQRLKREARTGDRMPSRFTRSPVHARKQAAGFRHICRVVSMHRQSLRHCTLRKSEHRVAFAISQSAFRVFTKTQAEVAVPVSIPARDSHRIMLNVYIVRHIVLHVRTELKYHHDVSV